jgi:hypothetical protein
MNSDGLLPLVLNCSRNVAVHSALTSLRGNESHHCKQGGTAYRRPCSAMVFFYRQNDSKGIRAPYQQFCQPLYLKRTQKKVGE